MYLKERVIAGVRAETVSLILCQGSQGRSAVSTQQRQSVQVQRESGKEKYKKKTLISRGLQESTVYDTTNTCCWVYSIQSESPHC